MLHNGNFTSRRKEDEKMLTLLCMVFLVVIFGKLGILALKAAWSVSKILVTVVFFPLILIALVLAGLFYISIPILVIAGIVVLCMSIAN